MVKHPIKVMLVVLILIGVAELALMQMFGGTTVTYLNKVWVNNGWAPKFYYYKLDIWQYISNLEFAVTDTGIWEFNIPNMVWTPMTITNTWDALSGNLKLVANSLIIMINGVLWPLRAGAYITRILLTAIGINTNGNDPNNGLAWLAKYIINLVTAGQIPYIP